MWNTYRLRFFKAGQPVRKSSVAFWRLRLMIKEMPSLSLYAYDTCPFCRRVYRAIEELGLDVEIRNVVKHSSYRDELITAMGRGTVPVLRIEQEGNIEWLPESRDIIAWLHANGRQSLGDE